jgi:peptidoglycan/xylan/chitin deacetylase (PgdA/CDA1 family)/SAM-dependent methyltransferase
MSRDAVATVILCRGLTTAVVGTLESVSAQAGGAGEIVLVADATTSARARPWLEALARQRHAVLVWVDERTGGAARNAGVEVTTAPYVMCVEAGERLAPSCHHTLRAQLGDDPGAAAITSAVLYQGAGEPSAIEAAGTLDLESVVGDLSAIHSASLFSREAWRTAGGFDRELPALEAYDFWLTVLERGGRICSTGRAVVIRRRRYDAAALQTEDRPEHHEAFTRIIAKHAASFSQSVVTALVRREECVQALAPRYLALRARRAAAIDGIAAVDATLGRQPSPAQFEDLRRVTPVSGNWGYERGAPVDRFYIERFMEQHAADVRGAVLEVQEADYTRRFGRERVTSSDVVDLDAGNASATIISDLRCAANLPDNQYDCIIITQTIHVIDDMPAVVKECFRILRPGGVLLATLPSASRVCVEYGYGGDHWRVTDAGAVRLFSQAFAEEDIEAQPVGNVLANAAFLYGLASSELSASEFAFDDPHFPLIVVVRAVKGRRDHGERQRRADARVRSTLTRPAAILMYHRVARTTIDIHGLAVPPEEFRAHMSHIAAHYQPMSLDAVAAALKQGALPERAVAVTFDDGYIDNVDTASPVLVEYGIPATFFLTTDRLEDASAYEYWWDALESILLEGDAFPPALTVTLRRSIQTLPTRSHEERLSAHRVLYDAIVRSPAEERDEVIRTLETWRSRPTPSRRRMTLDELRTLAARPGHRIGAHGAQHLMLPACDHAAKRAEIGGSRDTLARLLGRSVDAFAYAFGAVDDASREVVATAGFTCAVSCEDAPMTVDADLLKLPRVEVSPRRSRYFAAWLDALSAANGDTTTQ